MSISKQVNDIVGHEVFADTKWEDNVVIFNTSHFKTYHRALYSLLTYSLYKDALTKEQRVELTKLMITSLTGMEYIGAYDSIEHTFKTDEHTYMQFSIGSLLYYTEDNSSRYIVNEDYEYVPYEWMRYLALAGEILGRVHNGG